MKAPIVIGTLLTVLMSLSTNAFSEGSYYPPERIPCVMDNTGKVKCMNFDRSLLREDTYTADFIIDKNIIFNFTSAVAYFTPDEKYFTVYYTFKNYKNEMIKLKTVNTQIKPDFENGRWEKFKNEFYTCRSGYMSCPIVDA